MTRWSAINDWQCTGVDPLRRCATSSTCASIIGTRRVHRPTPIMSRLRQRCCQLKPMEIWCGGTDVHGLIEGVSGTALTHLSSMSVRCAPRGDLAIRRSIERVAFEVRAEIAKVHRQKADKYGEPV